MYAPHSSSTPAASSVPATRRVPAASSIPVTSSEAGRPRTHSPRAARSAFTLTELLIVIAIIAVLAGLIAAAAVNAMRAANRGRISLEIKQISASLEDFKINRGAYPPNGMNPSPANNPNPGTPAALVQSDFERMFKMAFPSHQEPRQLILALCGQNLSGGSNENLVKGMTAAEALYFWLGGFSSDERYPISGPNGPSFLVGGNSPGEILENRDRLYEFDLGRLGPRTEDGFFDEDAGRYLLYQINMGNGVQTRRINMWRYTPPGSDQPLVYFDTSRHKPTAYDLWAADPVDGPAPWIVALKQVRSGANPNRQDKVQYLNSLVFVNQGKFQVLHCGLDGAWGEQFRMMHKSQIQTSPDDFIAYPDGPFLGEVADTLTNFTDGTLEDAAEQ